MRIGQSITVIEVEEDRGILIRYRLEDGSETPPEFGLRFPDVESLRAAIGLGQDLDEEAHPDDVLIDSLRTALRAAHAAQQSVNVPRLRAALRNKRFVLRSRAVESA